MAHGAASPLFHPVFCRCADAVEPVIHLSVEIALAKYCINMKEKQTASGDPEDDVHQFRYEKRVLTAARLMKLEANFT